MESLLIEHDRPDLNRSIKSMPLELFITIPRDLLNFVEYK